MDISFLIMIIFIALLIYILYLIFKSPFKYPYFEYYFDVSGKKNPQIENYIDYFLIERQFLKIYNHQLIIENWKLKCQKKLSTCLIKKYRTKQFYSALDDENAYNFYFTRQQTRYRQVNYLKTAYKFEQIVDKYSCSYNYLFKRNKLLKSINYECSINEYNSKNQRRLMTKELRKQIIIRDNYTCKKCGKYMLDEVGLQIDHIIPISKGGKTVPSNLQVLCSKCNGAKQNK